MSYEDLTIVQAQHFYEVGNVIHQAALIHGLMVLGDGVAEHVCGFEDADYSIEDQENPEYTIQDLNAYLAYEHALLANCKIMRAGFRAQGFPVEEEISTESLK